MNRTRWTRPEKMLWLMPGVFCVFVGALILAPRFSRSAEALLETLGVPTKEAPRRSSCQSNLKIVGLGLFQYVRDYDEKFPLVASRGQSFGWADALQPYLKTLAIYHCPKNSQVVASIPTSRGYTDYFYNARLSGQSMAWFNNSAQTVVFGEGTSSNARYAKSQLPPTWVSDPHSPARLHFALGSATRSGANYALPMATSNGSSRKRLERRRLRVQL